MDSFGRYLIQQRELRGMSREDVIRATRLSPGSVDALEGDHPQALPARVFVLGTIRAYAGSIGLSPDEAVLRYEEWAQHHPAAGEAALAPARLGRIERSPWRGKLAVAAVAAVGLAAALAWWLR